MSLLCIVMIQCDVNFLGPIGPGLPQRYVPLCVMNEWSSGRTLYFILELEWHASWRVFFRQVTSVDVVYRQVRERCSDG